MRPCRFALELLECYCKPANEKKPGLPYWIDTTWRRDEPSQLEPSRPTSIHDKTWTEAILVLPAPVKFPDDYSCMSDPSWTHPKLLTHRIESKWSSCCFKLLYFKSWIALLACFLSTAGWISKGLFLFWIISVPFSSSLLCFHPCNYLNHFVDFPLISLGFTPFPNTTSIYIFSI